MALMVVPGNDAREGDRERRMENSKREGFVFDYDVAGNEGMK